VERIDVARDRGGEPAYGDAADAVGAFGILVLPGHVVLGATGQHVDVVARRKALGHEAAQMLGSSEHLRAVPLDDESDLHDSVCRSAVSSRVMRASPKSASRRRWPAMTCARSPSSKARAPRSSAAYSRSFGANCTPAPASVSGTAAAAYASTGTSAAIASTSGTQKPSCSLIEMYTAA